MMGKVYFMLDSYASTRFSEGFINLIKGMLQPEPYKRIDIEESHEYFKKFSERDRPVYCIRLEADPNTDI